MTDQSPAYTQALDQLRAERDELRGELFKACNRIGELTDRAEAAKKDRDDALKYANDNVAEVKERAVAATNELHETKCQLADELARAQAAEKERDALRAQLEAVTAERDELRMGKAYWRGVANDARVALHADNPRTPTDLETQTGPAAHERNQLRDEITKLRTKLATAEHRAAMHDRNTDETQRALVALETVFCAAIRAVARGVK